MLTRAGIARCQALVVTAPLLVVFQSRSGGTQRLVDAAVSGARLASEDPECLVVKHAFDAVSEDVRTAGGLLIATPANFGYMSGAMKDFFERIYPSCLDLTVGKPYSMIVKGDTDVDGAAESVRRIATGMRWREVLPSLLVVGAISDFQLDEAQELGATLAAGIEAGIY
jgi:NAD(P)H-dependent FMN reductase